MDKQWTWEVPTEPGWYWFCGSFFGVLMDVAPVKVYKVGNGVSYVGGGAVLYPGPRGDGHCIGAWMKMDVPEFPMKKEN